MSNKVQLWIKKQHSEGGQGPILHIEGFVCGDRWQDCLDMLGHWDRLYVTWDSGKEAISDEYPAPVSDNLTGDDLSTVDDGKRSCILCEHLYNGYWCLVKDGPRHLIHVCDAYQRARDKNWSWGANLDD